MSESDASDSLPPKRQRADVDHASSDSDEEDEHVADEGNTVAEFPEVSRAAVIAWDTETTGLRGVVIQIGYCILDHEAEEIGSGEWLLAPIPGHPVEPRALSVHHITDERRAEEGKLPGECLEAFGRLVAAAASHGVPLVAHNAAFDLGRMKYTASVLPAPRSVESSLCTMKLGGRVMNKKRGTTKLPKNAELYECLFGKEPSGRLHDAIADARITAHSYMEGKRQKFW